MKIGPPPVRLFTGLTWSNLVRASDVQTQDPSAFFASLLVVFCGFQLSFVARYL